jgi:hypothetical protein
MIAHVAEAGEKRGRVVLQLSSSGRCSDVALEAAVRVAKAFNSEIESLILESEDLLNVAGFSFAKELSLTGRSLRNLEQAVIEEDLRSAAAALQRRVQSTARQAEVPCHFRTVRGDPVEALSTACTESGPWNVIALADPWDLARSQVLSRILSEVHGMTGIVLSGTKARSIEGPVVAVIENLSHLSSMLRAAKRIASVADGEVHLLVIGEENDLSGMIEGQVRLALGEQGMAHVSMLSIRQGTPNSIAEILRGLRAGFVIAEAQGILMPPLAKGRAALDLIEGSVLLVT